MAPPGCERIVVLMGFSHVEVEVARLYVIYTYIHMHLGVYIKAICSSLGR